VTWNLAASRRAVFAPVTIATGIAVLAASVCLGQSGLDGTLPWGVLGSAAGFATSGSV
jgi:hypothetical protein